MVNVKEVTVGVLFFGALISLGLLTIMLSDFELFKKSYDYEILFDQANELKPQHNVLIMGTRQGKVTKVEFFEEPIYSEEHQTYLWVKATVRMDIPLQLKKDYTIAIRNANLLGGKVLAIRIGRSQTPLNIETTQLIGLAVRDPVGAISEFFERNKGYAESILAHVDEVVTDVAKWTGKISEGEGLFGRLIFDDALANNVDSAVGDIKKFMADLNRDDNTVALFTKDSETREKVLVGIEDVSQIVRDVRDGKGTLGQLIINPALHDNLLAISEDVKPITARLEAGEGFVGELLAAESSVLFEDTSATVANLRAYSDEMVDGEGVLAALAYDQELKDKVKGTVSEISEVVTNINQLIKNVQEGKGMLGMLLSDEKMAAKLQDIIDHMLDGLEDAREAAPLRSLGSFLFGAI